MEDDDIFTAITDNFELGDDAERDYERLVGLDDQRIADTLVAQFTRERFTGTSHHMGTERYAAMQMIRVLNRVPDIETYQHCDNAEVDATQDGSEDEGSVDTTVIEHTHRDGTDYEFTVKRDTTNSCRKDYVLFMACSDFSFGIMMSRSAAETEEDDIRLIFDQDELNKQNDSPERLVHKMGQHIEKLLDIEN